MDLKDKIAVVTGGASGIGAELCRRFMAEGAKAVVVVDRNAEAVAKECGGHPTHADVANEADIIRVIEETESKIGPIDLMVSNAGISCRDADTAASASNEDWQRIWKINVMAHIYAARALLPLMLSRGGGYFIHTASAAGLLSQIGSAPYSVTKHAAVAFAESLSITHGDQGIKVSVLCPQAVRTAMTAGHSEGGVAGVDGMLEPSQLANTVMEALADERFLILPHPEVLTYMRRKTNDYDRWLGGMRRFCARFLEAGSVSKMKKR